MMPVDLRGDEEFESWVEPYLAGLRRFAVTLVASRDDAEDLVQDALVNAWRKWATFDPARGSAQAWLFGILADQRRQWFRRRARPTLLHRTGDVLAGPTGIDVDLRRAVDRLPPRQRDLIILHYYVDLPLADIAAITRCALGTVKSGLVDARRNLARSLGEDYVSD